MSSLTQVINGKAFEYALAMAYYTYLLEKEVDVDIVRNNAFNNARECYSQLDFVERKRFDYCSALTIDSIVKIEPGTNSL
ncbi:MAG: HaeIII family restriction endonuclease [Candidatus Limimorpha sp.]